MPAHTREAGGKQTKKKEESKFKKQILVPLQFLRYGAFFIPVLHIVSKIQNKTQLIPLL